MEKRSDLPTLGNDSHLHQGGLLNRFVNHKGSHIRRTYNNTTRPRDATMAWLEWERTLLANSVKGDLRIICSLFKGKKGVIDQRSEKNRFPQSV